MSVFMYSTGPSGSVNEGSMQRRWGGLLIAAGLVVACTNRTVGTDQGEGSQGSAGSMSGAPSVLVDAGGEAAGGGGAGVGITVPPSQLSCGTHTCEGRFACCVASEACGVKVPTHIFALECIARVPPSGELDGTCPDSAEYCQRTRCQTFRGCRRETGTCGWWVDHVEVAGGEEILTWEVNLGCVQPELFLEL